MTLEEIINHDGRFKVSGYDGIAWYFDGELTKPDEDTEWTGIEVSTGLAKMVMVGDDRVFHVDPEDISPIAEGDYCPECGQIGCHAVS